MSLVTIIALLSAVPAGAKAVQAIADLIRQEMKDQAAANFLLQCTDLVRAIMDENMTNPVPFTPELLVNECAVAIIDYGMRMGFPVDENVLRSVGVMTIPV